MIPFAHKDLNSVMPAPSPTPIGPESEIAMRTLRTSSCAIPVLFLFVCATARVGLALAKDGPIRGSRITVPVTTPLTVTLDQVVSVKTAESSGGFTVTFSEPVRVDGMIVIPAGATGAGLVSRNSQNGTEMELNSVFVHGRSYRVTTSPIAFNQKGTLRAGTKFTFELMLSLSVVE